MFPKIEDLLLQYVTETWSNGYAVSTEMALRIAQDKGITTTAFKASNGWSQHFMKQHNLFRRRRTAMRQRLPGEYDEKLPSL